jgi:hypothetical protein
MSLYVYYVEFPVWCVCRVLRVFCVFGVCFGRGHLISFWRLGFWYLYMTLSILNIISFQFFFSFKMVFCPNLGPILYLNYVL